MKRKRYLVAVDFWADDNHQIPPMKLWWTNIRSEAIAFGESYKTHPEVHDLEVIDNRTDTYLTKWTNPVRIRACTCKFHGGSKYKPLPTQRNAT